MIARRSDGGPDPIDDYLDELLARLRGTAHDVRRALVECESHLRQRAADALAAGRSEDDAAREAVAAFGSARRLAGEFNTAHRPHAVRTLLLGLAGQAWRLTAVGLSAIGASAVLAWLLSMAVGARTVFADAPGTRYDAASCAHYLAVQPTAHSCAAAALLEGRDDALLQRIAAGLVGLALLAALVWWRRRRGPDTQHRPDLGVHTSGALAGAALFGVAGLCLTAYGIDRAVVSTGSGQWLSAAGVAIAAALAYLVVFWRTLTSIPEA